MTSVRKDLSDYLKAYDSISSKETGKNLKIAILTSFTTKGLKEVISVKCHDIGVNSEIYVCDYNQYSQEIFDNNSGMYKFNPDLIILFMDSMSVLGENYLLPYQIPNDGRREWAEEKSNDIIMLVKKLKESCQAKIILHNLAIPSFSPLGIAENKQPFGFIESVEFINSRLRDSFKNDDRVFVFDYDSFCSKIGKERIMDYKMYYLGDLKINLQYIPALCDEYMAYIKPLMSLTKKCIVLDLDNTLWGGIVGEDGFDGIKLGPTPDGRPFWEFQKYLLSLFNRGVILSINSKNNYDDALKVIREHPYMVLKENHFAAMQINWNDKISNMKLIAKDINIGTDSLVFIDDDKLNREMIRDSFSEIFVVDLPDDPALYLNTLIGINDFNTFRITEEDKKKGQMYAEQRKRKNLEQSATDITDYLRKLKMVVTIKKADSFNIPRISQLTQKTNQFNMTTRRYYPDPKLYIF